MGLYSDNETLDLFWRTMKACGVPQSEALKMLHRIEEKHGISVSGLPSKSAHKNYGKLIKLKKEDISFYEELKKTNSAGRFSRFAGVGISSLRKAVKKGYATPYIYERFEKAKRKWLEGRENRIHL